MLVLALLTQTDRYGYEIVSTISEYIEISEGTIYPLFNRLKKEKYVETYLKRVLYRTISEILSHHRRWTCRI